MKTTYLGLIGLTFLQCAFMGKAIEAGKPQLHQASQLIGDVLVQAIKACLDAPEIETQTKCMVVDEIKNTPQSDDVLTNCSMLFYLKAQGVKVDIPNACLLKDLVENSIK
jgi:hypothetical protein